MENDGLAKLDFSSGTRWKKQDEQNLKKGFGQPLIFPTKINLGRIETTEMVDSARNNERVGEKHKFNI